MSDKQQCSKCLGWFASIDKHRSKGCELISGFGDFSNLPREQLSMYDRLELSRRKTSSNLRKKERDEDIEMVWGEQK